MKIQDTKTLRNTTAVPQSLIYKGRQFVLGEHEEQSFAGDVADAFLGKCAPVVVDIAYDIGHTTVKHVEDTEAWVANVTGNPASPDLVEQKYFDKSSLRWSSREIKNPNKAPHTISRESKGGHFAYTASDGGLVQKSLPSTVWTILPYRRVKMHKATADWFVTRDGSSGASRGACIMSRAPSEFEPDMTWSLDDMRVYMKLVMPDAPLGPDEAKIIAQAKSVAAKWAKTHTDAKPEDVEAKVKEELRTGLNAAKQALFRQMYFVLVDPAYTLPSRKEFREFISGKSEDSISDDDMAELLAKADASMKNTAVPSIED
jgi:hypothetical protein